MGKFTLVAVGCAVPFLLQLQPCRGQDLDSLLKSWQAMRRGVKWVECTYKLTTTHYPRKADMSGGGSRQSEHKTDLEVHASFDFDNQEYQIVQAGKVFRLRDAKVVDYSDSTTLKHGKLYGYVAPPLGQPSGVGRGAKGASDLAIIESGLDSHFLPDTVVPCLTPVGIVPISPVHNLTSTSWWTYSPVEHADLLQPPTARGTVKVTIRQNEVFESVIEVGPDNRITSVSKRRDGKRVSVLRFHYTAPAAQLSGWTRDVYSGNSRVTTHEATIRNYEVFRDSHPGRTIAPPVITPGLVVAKIPTLDVGENPGNEAAPTVDIYRVERNGQLTRISSENARPPSTLRVILGSISVAVLVCCATLLLRSHFKRKLK